MILSLLTILSVIFSLANSHGDSNGNGFQFIGDNHWPTNYRQLCDDVELSSQEHKKELFCKSYILDYRPINVEILSYQPILVIFRNVLVDNDIDQIVNMAEEKQYKAQRVLEQGASKLNDARMANGTYFHHQDNDPIIRVGNRLKRIIPNVDLSISEAFSVLSYHPGGHYAPHYDYLEYSDEEEYDWYMRNYRNRFMTLILVFKTAEKGGGTVFPRISTTVRPERGDVFFFGNMNEFEQKDLDSLHGGCPIYSGEKIIATLWIRIGGQPVLATCAQDGTVDISKLISPSRQDFYRKPYNGASKYIR